MDDVDGAALTCDFLLVVVVVAGGEQVAEDERWDVHLLVLVLHHRDSLAVVPHGDGVGLSDGEWGRGWGRGETRV